MKKNNELGDALDAIVKVTDNDSWFRGHPYRWAKASLPLAYAVAFLGALKKFVKRTDWLIYCLLHPASVSGTPGSRRTGGRLPGFPR